ncbi:MAG: hypothetical protein EXS08_03840 [Planctomycetes bacterium]|nr:hypothetical protein [Planctomycetota bacterium]
MSSSRAFTKHYLPVFVLAAGSFAWFATRASAAAPAPLANDTIEAAMKQMNQAFKALGKGITAETRAAALEELTKFENAVISAKAQTPDTATAVDEKKRPAFVAEFRANLCEVLKLAADAEIAVVNGKYKDAEGLLKGKLGALKSGGHDKFKKDDEGGGKGK